MSAQSASAVHEASDAPDGAWPAAAELFTCWVALGLCIIAPSCPVQEKEAWALGAANRLTAIKHRYADALDWKDDSSTLRTVDVPPGERREKARRLRSACPPSERGASRPAAKPLILRK